MRLSACIGKPGVGRGRPAWRSERRRYPRGSRVPRYNARVLSLVLSTIAFFVAVYFIKHYLDEIGVPKTAVRGLVVFVLALAAAYGVAFIVDRAAGLAG